MAFFDFLKRRSVRYADIMAPVLPPQRVLSEKEVEDYRLRLRDSTRVIGSAGVSFLRPAAAPRKMTHADLWGPNDRDLPGDPLLSIPALRSAPPQRHIPGDYEKITELYVGDRLFVPVGSPETLPRKQHAPGPIPMVLHCPRCFKQHIDGPSEGWTNPAHRSHKCLRPDCKTIWRPADVATTGVQAIETEGNFDNWPSETKPDPVPPALLPTTGDVLPDGTIKNLIDCAPITSGYVWVTAEQAKIAVSHGWVLQPARAANDGRLREIYRSEPKT